MKTFIRWPGNKGRHLKHIKPYLPTSYNTYIEPFLGSGALLLHLQPKKWIINDINTDIISLWQSIASDCDYIVKKLKEFAKALEPMDKHDRLSYCQRLTQQSLPRLKFGKRRAALYLALTFCAYLGHIVRRNKFVFTSLEPKIYTKRPMYFVSQKYISNLCKIREFIKSSQHKEIHNQNYIDTLNKAKRGDFVFIDPPYREQHDYQFNYNIGENIDNNFTNTLATQLKKLDKRNVKWLMTQADTPEVRALFKDYQITTYKVYRLASRSYRSELVIRNYN